MTDINQDPPSLISYRLSKRRLKGRKEAKFATLKKQVIDTGLCSSCGACIASCSEHALEMINDRPRLTGKCTACGVCVHQCPKTKTTVPQLINRGAVALRILGRHQAKDQKHQDQRINHPFAHTPLRIVLRGHLMEQMDHLVPHGHKVLPN